MLRELRDRKYCDNATIKPLRSLEYWSLSSLALRLCRFLGGLLGVAVLVSHPDGKPADLTVANTPLSGSSIVANLEYKVLTNGYVSASGIRADSLRDTPKLRPEVEKHQVRGYSVRLKDGPPIAIIWDRTSNVLYFDLNRNLDFTDDPAGAITNEFAGNVQSPLNSASFKNVCLTVPTKEAQQPFLLDLMLVPLPTADGLYIDARVRSYWHGKLTIDGTDHEIAIIDDPFERSGVPRVLLRSWEQRNQPLRASYDNPNIFILPHELFFRGHLYAVSHQLDTNTSPVKWRLALTETPAQLGEVTTTGKHIDRIVLTSKERAVVLDKPGSLERIPVGDYVLDNVALKSGRCTAVASIRPVLKFEKVKVQTTGQTTLVLGGPLTNSISIVRRSKTLVFNYELRGEGGLEYRLIGDDAIVQPEFAVYSGERKIASGKFEFG